MEKIPFLGDGSPPQGAQALNEEIVSGPALQLISLIGRGLQGRFSWHLISSLAREAASFYVSGGNERLERGSHKRPRAGVVVALPPGHGGGSGTSKKGKFMSKRLTSPLREGVAKGGGKDRLSLNCAASSPF